MKHRWIVKLFGIALFATIIVAGFGQAVLQLWNWLMPAVFGLQLITFWQAVGLMALSWILFGGLRGFGMHSFSRGRRGRWRREMEQRWKTMTPQEREQFVEGLRTRC